MLLVSGAVCSETRVYEKVERPYRVDVPVRHEVPVPVTVDRPYLVNRPVPVRHPRICSTDGSAIVPAVCCLCPIRAANTTSVRGRWIAQFLWIAPIQLSGQCLWMCHIR